MTDQPTTQPADTGSAAPAPTDVYAVGLLRDLSQASHVLRRGRPGARVRNAVLALRRIPATLKREMRGRNWRGLRSYFNGYLAEHDGCRHNAGRGWTRRTAGRSVARLHADAASRG